MGRLTKDELEANAQAELDEQARLSRIAARREARASAPEDAAHAFEQAVARVGVEWSRRIQDRPAWRQRMHAARTAMRLTPEQGARIAETWEREAVGGLSTGQPDLDELWSRWSSTREWLRKAADPPALYAVHDQPEPIDDPWAVGT